MIRIFIATLLLVILSVPVCASSVQTTGYADSSNAGFTAQQDVANSYHASSNAAGGFSSLNRRHGWQIHFDRDGSTTLGPIDNIEHLYTLGLKLKAFGRSKLEILHQPLRMTADETTVTYEWNSSLQEMWINSESQLEQWFVLNSKPSDSDSSLPLTLQMELLGNLEARQTTHSIQFITPENNIIRYDKLKVWDADGIILTSHMDLDGDQLNLVVDDSDAQYPLTIDPSFQQQAYIKASNAEAGDYFGGTLNSRKGLAISGDTLVISAPQEDSNAAGVNGDESDNTNEDSGAVYVFVRNGVAWSQQAYLKASVPTEYSFFGASVAISGDTVAVGVPRDDSNAVGIDGDPYNTLSFDSGAVYIFTRNGTNWSQTAYIKASNTGIGDRFGSSVSIDGDTLVVGAFWEDSDATGVGGDQGNNSAIESGAAYVFTRAGGTWSQQAYLKGSNTENGDRFGTDVAVSGDTVAISATSESSNATGVDGDQSNNDLPGAGAVYIFSRTGSTWSQQAYIKASNPDEYDFFGAIALSGNSLAVGAQGESSSATGVGGDQADNSEADAGAVYVFTRSGSSWSQQAYLKASNTDAYDNFNVVALDGDVLIVGARGENSNATGVDGDQNNNLATGPGAAYVFTRTGSVWSQQSYLKASTIGVLNYFGGTVAVAGQTLAVGAQGESSSSQGINGDQTQNYPLNLNTGAAYVFAPEGFSLGGTVSGLTGSGLLLQTNYGDNLEITTNGQFTFETKIFDLAPYNVTVGLQPANPYQQCTVSNGSGTVAGANVANVVVDCVVAPAPVYSVFNDTGIVTCADDSSDGLPCPQALFPNQDADYGRDVTANDNSDGHAGFSFTKLDANGYPLVLENGAWSCVRDNVTGLIWEVKTDDGGLRDKDHVYGSYQQFVDDVNSESLCGANDWRVPTLLELQSILLLDSRAPAVDESYFPNGGAYYWTAGGKWFVGLAGRMTTVTGPEHIRLVRNAP